MVVDAVHRNRREHETLDALVRGFADQRLIAGIDRVVSIARLRRSDICGRQHDVGSGHGSPNASRVSQITERQLGAAADQVLVLRHRSHKCSYRCARSDELAHEHRPQLAGSAHDEMHSRLLIDPFWCRLEGFLVRNGHLQFGSSAQDLGEPVERAVEVGRGDVPVAEDESGPSRVRRQAIEVQVDDRDADPRRRSDDSGSVAV